MLSPFFPYLHPFCSSSLVSLFLTPPGLLLPQGLCTCTDIHMPLPLSDFTRHHLLGKAFPLSSMNCTTNTPTPSMVYFFLHSMHHRY